MIPRIAPPVSFAALLFATNVAFADPPGPKVCVAVAGDPDESVRASAETVADAVSRREGMRGVADADARAALRGEPNAAPDFADLATARRGLRGEDRDAAALDAVSTRLGCGLVVELMARPSGTLVRVYDPVQHTWPASRELASVDATVVDGVIVPALSTRTAGASAQPAGGRAANAAATGDRRVATTRPHETPSLWSRAWPWVAVGGVALAVVGAYLLADHGVGSSSTRVTVVHPGVP